jgi:hypothetical protein
MKKTSDVPADFQISARLLCLLIMTFAFISPVGNLKAQESSEPAGITLGLESDAASDYVWRGLDFSDGPVAQNSAWATFRSLTLSLWSNYRLGASAIPPRLDEIDAGLSYSAAFGPITLEPMVQTYMYPNQSDVPSTIELSLRAAVAVGSFEPFLAQTWDVKEYSGAYFGEIGVAYSWAPSSKLLVETMAELGWGSKTFNEAYVGPVKSSLQLAMWDLSATYTIRGGLYVRPHMSVSTVTDKVLREELDHPSMVQCGLALGFEF